MVAICAIADVYNGMTTDRVYKEAIPAHEVYEILMKSGDTLFKYKVVTNFSSIIVPYPDGTYICLNNDEIACVVSIDPIYPFQPKVRLISIKLNLI